MECAGVIVQISWDAFLNYVARTLHARRFGGFVENLSGTMKQQFLLFSYLLRSFHAVHRALKSPIACSRVTARSKPAI